ncbi:T9SS type A sorting domain-containing protein [Lentimicrobium sp. L6]|uniref:T9SS type A sorting domain-containing protein n=1 Tax=Lentimicrobium sp. L6 TaxID=2735916 RepID=UPI0015570E17|nr:T9SS type A sorting domain-containing protein [Lentimicrobium sp. L6]NPD83942.1 T9SS type A sorting domain-containing protein [Lentimicrobium sp. L6]
MKQQIINGQTIIGAKENLEAQLQNSKAEYSNAFNHILARYTHDTVNNNSDSILYLLSQSQNIESRYQLAGIYLQNNETTAANQVLNSIATDFTLDNEDAYELDKLQEYYQILANVKNNNRSIYELTDTEKAEILLLSKDTVNLASAWARNLLIYLGEKEYQAPIYLPEFENKSALITEPFDINIPKEEYAEINMYPNPARDYVICEYDIKIAFQSAELVITETSTGKRLDNIAIEQKQDSKTIDLKSFKSGNYIITLKIDGKAINSTTFNIIK